SKVTGLVPNTLLRRIRICCPQMPGRTIRRMVWSLAPAAGSGNAKRWSGCADTLPTGYGPCAEAAQLTIHFWLACDHADCESTTTMKIAPRTQHVVRCIIDP